jgi:predicted transcriptional regulator
MEQHMKQVTIRADETVLQTIGTIAIRRNVATATVIREALKIYVAKAEQQVDFTQESGVIKNSGD